MRLIAWCCLVLAASSCRSSAAVFVGKSESEPTKEGEDGCGSDCGSWYVEAGREAQRYISQCRAATGAFQSFSEDLILSAIRLKNCLKERFLTSLDDSIGEKELPLTPYLTLINQAGSKQTGDLDPHSDALNNDIISSITKRFSRILNTHSFKFNFGRLWSNSSDSEELEDEEGNEESEEFIARSWERESRRFPRGRRRRQQYRKAFPMMVAGYMMMSAFLVPLGFQFMAMIGGKALLLAKMAFFMSLFSGYKRLTNDLEYHHHVVPPPPVAHVPHHDYHLPHYGGFHHRSSREEPLTAAMLRQLAAIPQQVNGLQAQALSQLGLQQQQLRRG